MLRFNRSQRQDIVKSGSPDEAHGPRFNVFVKSSRGIQAWRVALSDRPILDQRQKDSEVEAEACNRRLWPRLPS